MEKEVDELYEEVKRIAENEFADVIELVESRKDRVRLHLVDGSFLDVWFSRTIKGKYSFHWQRGEQVLRRDNAAHERWRHLETFPHHLHVGDSVYPFEPGKDLIDTFRKVMAYVRSQLSREA